MTEPTRTTLPGFVEAIINSSGPGEIEKAQIAIQGADGIVSEIRVVNTLTQKNGDESHLEKGDAVKVIITS